MLLKNFTAIAALVAATNVSAQPVIKASKTVGGANGTDNLYSILKTKDGGFITGGNSSSSISGNKTDSVRGPVANFDYWIVKYDANGKIQKDITLGGDKEDDYVTTIQTNDGGYLVAGSSYSGIYAEKTDTCRGQIDYWIVKLSANGKVMWDKTYGGNSNDFLSCVQQTSDGGYIIGGNSSSGISGEKTQPRTAGYYAMWLVKTDANGNKLWDKTIGGSSFYNINSILQTADGGYMIGGATDSTTGLTDAYLLIKTDAFGNQQWRKLYGANNAKNNDEFTNLVGCSDGGYLLAGSSNSLKGGVKTESTKGDFDYWVIKVDANGNVLWDKTIGGSAEDILTNAIQVHDGSFILTGYSKSGISGDKTEANRNVETDYITQDYWVVKIEANGNILWNKTIGGGNDDIASASAEIRDGLYVVGGYSGSNISGDKKQNTKSGVINTYDFWLVSLLDTTLKQQQILQKTVETFTVYPNPAKEKIFIENKRKATYSVMNASGNILLTQTINQSGSINISKLLPGIYYVKDMATNISKTINVIR